MEGREDARVVTLSSNAHKFGRINFDNLNGERRYFRWNAYGQSKLANLLFALELDRRLRAEGSTVKSLAAHPGYSADQPPERRGAAGRPPGDEGGQRRGRPERRDGRAAGAVRGDPAGPRRAARTSAPTAIGEHRGHPTIVSPNRAARNEVTARRLWEVSEELTAA